MAKKLKGIKKLNKAITELVEPFGISEAKLGTDFAYYFTDEHIEFQMTCGDWTDELFDKFVEEEFGFKNPYPFVLSILHEIGHHNTWEEIDDDVYDIILKKKERIAKIIQNKKNSREKKIAADLEYFNLPDEYAATAWAVDYFTQNRKECDEMYKKACEALCKFYQENEITED